MTIAQQSVAHDQVETVAFLSSPTAYAGRPRRVERHETHGAYVFVAGAEAYKIKRAVRFAYMDFSTLERRRLMLEREFTINQRFAPEIYLGVTPITRETDGRLRIGGTGAVVEWALRMRAFPQDQLLSDIADNKRLTPAICHRLADAVFESHGHAHEVPHEHGATDMVKTVIDVADGLAAVKSLHAPDAHAFRDQAQSAVRRAAVCLDARNRAGFVRRCHGDLHLSNIVLWNGIPTLFDAIEFDDQIATVDTLYDLAFLLMDLDHHGLRAEANVVLNRYLSRSGVELDLEGLVAMPLFLALRSAVRSMVHAQRAAQSNSRATAEKQIATSYLAHALAYLNPAEPRLVAIGGLSGTGKSTLAAAIAPHLDPAPGAIHLRSDLERKAMFGVPFTERLPPDSYTRETSARVYDRLFRKARIALAAGQSVVMDAVFAKPDVRETIADIASDLRVPCTGFWLTAPRDVLLKRVAARTGDASDATPSVVERQLTQDIGPMAWFTVDSGGSRAAIERAVCATLGVSAIQVVAP